LAAEEAARREAERLAAEEAARREAERLAAAEAAARREFNLVPADERPPQFIYGIDPNALIPEITRVTPEVVPPAPVVTDRTFSVPRINELASGWYYVQIAALNTPEAVENALRQIDHSYKPVVFNTGDNLYRILLGPMNQGESAAVLQRFRSIGYRDAFVRHAR